jgi:histidine kinase/DNA gyrase B/HSP90-like ATPase
VGETRVDLLHLLEDLRDAYPGTTEETILAEIVANALDSGARTITLATDATARTLTIVDDGRGMRRRELARYHDIAATTKVRGETIGFAGVGIKIALLVSSLVVTETRTGRQHVATSWGLSSRHRAPWRWTPPPGLVDERGTAVRLTLDNGLSPLLDAGYLETVVRRHFEPLLTPPLAAFLASRYRDGVRFVVNGRTLESEPIEDGDVATLGIRLGRQRKPAALGWLVRAPAPLGEDRIGLAVSTLGKVIKRGWEWLGVTPTAPERLTGGIEVPALAQSLTLNKADFIRGGGRGATYLTYRKAIQDAVSRQLALWGDAAEPSDQSRRRVVRPVERDLERVLADLAADFPLLASLVERHPGGQARLPAAGRSPATTAAAVVAGGPVEALAGLEATSPVAPGVSESRQARSPDQAPPASVVEPSVDGPRRRPGRYGLGIDFEHRPSDPELARLVESTIWINDAHPAYRRAAASRSEGYHLALATALALAPLAVEPAKEHAFVTAFLTAWGEAVDRRPRRGRRA